MATLKSADDQHGSESSPVESWLWPRFERWLVRDFSYFLASTVAHVVVLVLAALITVRAVPTAVYEAPSFDATSDAVADREESDAPLERFELAETPLEPSELSTETLTL